MNKNIKITKELQDTLLLKENQKEVYFDKEGRHYFNVHTLPTSKKDPTEGLFGTGQFSHRQIIPGKTNVDKLTEAVSVGSPETMIVETISREDILAFKVEEEKKDLVGDVLKLPKEQLAALKAILNEQDKEKPKAKSITPELSPAPADKK